MEIKIDINEEDSYTYTEYITGVLYPWYETIKHIDSQLQDVASEITERGLGKYFSFDYTSIDSKLVMMEGSINTLSYHLGHVHTEVVNVMDESIYRDLESVVSDISRLSIEDCVQSVDDNFVVQVTKYGAGESMSAPSIPYTTTENHKKVSFSELMKSAFAREMKSEEYKNFLEESGWSSLSYNDQLYDGFINLSYRYNEFNYTTDMEELESFVTIVAAFIVTVGSAGLGIGSLLGASAPAWLTATIFASGKVLSIIPMLKLATGKNINGQELSPREIEGLWRELILDVGMTAISWSVIRYNKSITKVTAIDDIAKANGKTLEEIEEVMKLTGMDIEDLNKALKTSTLDDIVKGANSNKYGIDVEKLEFSDTAKKHSGDVYKRDKTVQIGENGEYKTIHYAGESSRPYVDNGTSLLVDDIINGGTPIPDPGGLPNGLRWDVPGTLNGKQGVWELVIDKDTNRIVHFLFNSKK